MRISSLQYTTSAFRKSQFPKGNLPEIAFAGRSNVGKSSLLNCLVGKDIAKISGTPGKTRAINFFLVNEKFYFVDLPGYGYARVSKEMRHNWQELIEGYLSQRASLKATVVIIDVRREVIPPSDIQMMDYLHEVGVVCVPVFTKADKLKQSERVRMKKAHSRQLPNDCSPVLFSSVTREGADELWKRLAGYLA
jgi:GTP-binding protein